MSGISDLLDPVDLPCGGGGPVYKSDVDISDCGMSKQADIYQKHEKTTGLFMFAGQPACLGEMTHSQGSN